MMFHEKEILVWNFAKFTATIEIFISNIELFGCISEVFDFAVEIYKASIELFIYLFNHLYLTTGEFTGLRGGI